MITTLLKTHIRKATTKDLDTIWLIFKAVIATGDTYMFKPTTPKSDIKKYWFNEHTTTFIIEQNNTILGTYIIKANQIDFGNHIANCAYMVNPSYQGKGIGKQLCKHSIQFAKQQGYLGIQFNCVVSTNTKAIKLWESFGFKIIGTTPKGFRHAKLGLTDTYIMFKEL